MSSYDPRSWLDRLVGGCFSLLAAALAVYIAAKLVAAVWLVLVGLGAAAVAVASLVAVLRWRRQSW